MQASITLRKENNTGPSPSQHLGSPEEDLAAGSAKEEPRVR